MRKQGKIFILILFLCTANSSVFGQTLQEGIPNISFKIVRRTGNKSNCYDVFFQSSIAFNRQKITDAQVSIVVPKGKINHINLPDANIVGAILNSTVNFAPTFDGHKFEIDGPILPNTSEIEYLVFGINNFTATCSPNSEQLLFSFCLIADSPCPGNLRLLNGVSPFSPFKSGSKCTNCTIYSGAFDPSPNNLDPYNNMSIFNGLNPLEGYQGNNYGGETNCPMQEGQKYRLDKVYFEQSEAILLHESYEQLNEVLASMKENPTMTIQVEGHTDNVGDPKMNQKLSLDRAFAIRQYLIHNGIEGKRIKFVGYGQTKPIESNETAEGKAKNRRVEFVILTK